MNGLEKMVLKVRLAIRARRAKMSSPATSIVGLTGRAVTDIATEGTVFVRGELWPAQSQLNVSREERVQVTGVNGLMLNVETERDEAGVPNKLSAVDSD